MKSLALAATVVFAASLAALVTPAKACSCIPPDPWAFLRQSDGAFVGRLVSRAEHGSRAVLVFSVERAVKGDIGSRVEVETPISSAACGIETQVGARIGLFLERQGAAWYGTLCWQVSPDELLAAAGPLPAPNGEGPVALAVGGRFGPARVIALDRRGRTLAYGMGEGTTQLLSVCPGGQRIIDVTRFGVSELAVRDTSSLRVVRRHPLSLPGRRVPYAVRCARPDGATVFVFAGPGGDSGRNAAIFRLDDRRVTTLWRGTGNSADLAGAAAYVYTGGSGERGRLLAVDLASGRATRLAPLPDCGLSLTRAPGGRRLAGVAACHEGQPKIIVVDLSRRPPMIRTTTLPKGKSAGTIVWHGTDRLVFLPWFGRGTGRVLDLRLRTISRFPWTAGPGAVVGKRIFGVTPNGALIEVSLTSGRLRTLRRLPSRSANVIVAT